ncbi:hypothetical protein VNO77_29491 [Canavalia gladiata]|uniref:Uncharacterized protein n=1 Tax=Canavalia gladiata TaxID=3824 RepID=A0AAN9L0E8_CANGL
MRPVLFLPASMDLNDLNKVWEIKPLKRIGEDEARKILEKVAKQVQPIMRKRKWKVNILSEFCPANPSLLGLNIGPGAEIKLRLRRPNSEWDFFPYEQILDTMLHELCHNEHGPHNAQFYNLLDEIRKECEELMVKEMSGTGRGFGLYGRRLGGFSQQPPLSSLRQTALAAAESRAHHRALMPAGPRYLGGDNNIKSALSPIQAAAMAAERRLHDDMWCGSKSVGVETYIQENKSSTGPSERSVHTSAIQSTMANDIFEGAEWQCNTCTLLNKPLALLCEACGTKKQKDVSKFKVWSCKFCTLENSAELDRCLCCGEWRYSHGPPVSVRGPYIGT